MLLELHHETFLLQFSFCVPFISLAAFVVVERTDGAHEEQHNEVKNVFGLLNLGIMKQRTYCKIRSILLQVVILQFIWGCSGLTMKKHFGGNR